MTKRDAPLLSPTQLDDAEYLLLPGSSATEAGVIGLIEHVGWSEVRGTVSVTALTSACRSRPKAQRSA